MALKPAQAARCELGRSAAMERLVAGRDLVAEPMWTMEGILNSMSTAQFRLRSGCGVGTFGHTGAGGCLASSGCGRFKRSPCAATSHGAYPESPAHRDGSVVLKNENGLIRPVGTFPHRTRVGAPRPRGSVRCASVSPGHICRISACFVAPPICRVAPLTVARERQMSERRHTWSPTGQTQPRTAHSACSKGGGNIGMGIVCPAIGSACTAHDLEDRPAAEAGGRRHSLRMNSPEHCSMAVLTTAQGRDLKGG